MAKIDRYDGNLQAPASAALGTERTLFGSASQSDDLTDQFNADLLRGWGIVGPSDQPTLQDFNAMGYTLGQIHAYLHQMGVAEWNVAQEYHLGSIANVAGVLYVSLVNTNVGNIPSSSPSQWFSLTQGGVVAFTSAGVTNWTVPLAMQLGFIKPKVTIVGAGGGASKIAGTTGNGGGGGATAVKYLNLTGVTSVSVTVGAGGTGKTGGAGVGTNGGTTSFGAYFSAGGGDGGAAANGRAAGGIVGAGTVTADYGSAGQSGASSAGGGDGGSSLYGQGGRTGGIVGTASATAGNAGFGPGAGGGAGAAAGDGGNGFQGLVLIEW